MRLCTFFCLLFFILFEALGVWGQINNELYNLNTLDDTNYRQEMRKALNLKRQQPMDSWNQLRSILRNSQQFQNREAVIACLTELSFFTEDPKLLAQTLRFTEQGISLCDSQKHEKNLRILYDNMGKVYFWQSRYQESIKAHLKAVEYAKNDPLAAAKLENNMTTVLRAIGKNDLAVQYLKRCLKTGIKYNDGELWANALLNISCMTEDKPDMSLRYLDSGLQVAKKFKRYDILYRGMINKSSVLVQYGKNQQALRILEAADTLLPYFAISPVLQLKAAEIAGSVYTTLRLYPLAEKKLTESLAGTNAHNWFSNINGLSKLYATQGNYKKAYHTLLRFQERLDTLNLLSQNISDLEFQYRSAEKDKELAQNKLALVKKEASIKSRNTWIGIMASGAFVMLAMILLLRRNYQQKQKIQHSEQLNLQLKARIDGEELERERLSRDLHDGIGGILSAAKMNLTTIQPPGEAGDLIKYERSVQLMNDAYTELRRTAHNMSPAVLKSKGLVETVALFCQRMEEAHQIPIKFQHFGVPDTLRDEIALSVYRMIQELIQNIVKHSGANKAIVQLSCQDNGLQIAVEDRGKGMAQQGKIEGIGLSNIKNRVTALGGYIEIDSRIDEGTTVYISIDNAYA